MEKYVCSICGYAYDGTTGSLWDDLSADWLCPVCGASKNDFMEQTANTLPTARGGESFREPHEEKLRELGFGELSALFSNLSKGCEKQYKPEEAQLFGNLAEYYKRKSRQISEDRLADLLPLLQNDLTSGYPEAHEVSAEQTDRGALRALVWGEKVTRLMDSILKRYEKQGNALLENTKIFVCEICGFIYIGQDAPDICPVCKVPKFKIRQVQRGA